MYLLERWRCKPAYKWDGNYGICTMAPVLNDTCSFIEVYKAVLILGSTNFESYNNRVEHFKACAMPVPCHNVRHLRCDTLKGNIWHPLSPSCRNYLAGYVPLCSLLQSMLGHLVLWKELCTPKLKHLRQVYVEDTIAYWTICLARDKRTVLCLFVLMQLGHSIAFISCGAVFFSSLTLWGVKEARRNLCSWD